MEAEKNIKKASGKISTSLENAKLIYSDISEAIPENANEMKNKIKNKIEHNEIVNSALAELKRSMEIKKKLTKII